jgi:hypothetical protein
LNPAEAWQIAATAAVVKPAPPASDPEARDLYRQMAEQFLFDPRREATASQFGPDSLNSGEGCE